MNTTDTSNIFAGDNTLSAIAAGYGSNITTYTTNYTYTSPMNTSVHYLLSENKIMNISAHISNINFNVKKNKQIVKITISNNLDLFCYENIKKLVILDTINRNNFISYDIEFEKFETSFSSSALENNILTGVLTFNILDKYKNFQLTEMSLSSLNEDHRNLIKKELRNASLRNITKDL